VICGLTIATENPAYVQGDFNCVGPCSGGTWSTTYAATSIAADSVTVLSNKWNDVNSFLNPYGAQNTAISTYYRFAVMAGKGVSFPIPTGYTVADDFGTDGGTHNFLRYLENWANGGQSVYYQGSMVSMYYNRQGTGLYKYGGSNNLIYSPPARNYIFDTTFLTPANLPPRTPLFRDVNTTGFTQLLLPAQ